MSDQNNGSNNKKSRFPAIAHDGLSTSGRTAA
jgi:hypothetical protein